MSEQYSNDPASAQGLFAKAMIPILSSLFVIGVLTAAPAAQAQLLLKPGQGLAGAPKPIEPEPPEQAKPVTPQDGVTQLPQVDVDGKHDPLSESDRRLGKQKKALPGLGSDGKRNPGSVEKTIDAYNKLEKDPNKLSDHSKDFIERALKATPEGGHHEAVSPLIQREADDYADPIAAQQANPKKK